MTEGVLRPAGLPVLVPEVAQFMGAVAAVQMLEPKRGWEDRPDSQALEALEAMVYQALL